MTTRRDFILSVAADTDEYVKKMQALGGLTEKEAKKLGTLFASEQIKAQNIAAKAAMEAAKKAENAWDKANDEVQKGTQQTASKLQGLKKIAEGLGFSGAVNDIGDLSEGLGIVTGGISKAQLAAAGFAAAAAAAGAAFVGMAFSVDQILEDLEKSTGLSQLEFVSEEQLARIRELNLSLDTMWATIQLIPVAVTNAFPGLLDMLRSTMLGFAGLSVMAGDFFTLLSDPSKAIQTMFGGNGFSFDAYITSIAKRLAPLMEGIRAVQAGEARAKKSSGRSSGGGLSISVAPSDSPFLSAPPDGTMNGTAFTDAVPGFRGAEEQIGRIRKGSKETQKEIVQSGLALGAQLAGQLSGAIGAVMDGLTDRIERLQAQHREIIEQSRNLELDYLSELEQATLAGDERKAAAAAKNLEMIEEERNRKIKAIEEEEMRRKKAAKAVFAVQKALSIAEVAFNTAIGITSAFALTNPILIAIQTAAVASIGAAQIASILAQPPPFHRGGYVEGGLASDEKLIRARAGEYVLNPAATAQIGKQNLDAMNRGQGMAQTIVVQQVYTHRVLDIVMSDHLRLNTNLSRAIRGTRRIGQNLAPIRTHTGAA